MSYLLFFVRPQKKPKQTANGKQAVLVYLFYFLTVRLQAIYICAPMFR